MRGEEVASGSRKVCGIGFFEIGRGRCAFLYFKEGENENTEVGEVTSRAEN